jgi:hypothetical protein
MCLVKSLRDENRLQFPECLSGILQKWRNLDELIYDDG